MTYLRLSLLNILASLLCFSCGVERDLSALALLEVQRLNILLLKYLLVWIKIVLKFKDAFF